MVLLSIKYRWAWFVCLLLFLGFLTNSVSSYLVSKRNVRETIVETSLPLTSDNVYSEIQRDLLRPVFISSLMANDTFLKDWVIRGEEDESSVTKYLHEIKIKYGTVSSFFVSERSRKYYFSGGLLKEIQEDDERDDWYFRVREMKEDFEINVDPDLANRDEMTIFINYRVADSAGNFIGVTGVGLTVNRVNFLISSYEAKYERQIYFVDSTGKMVLRPSNSPMLNYHGLQDVEGLNAHVEALLAGDLINLSYERGGKTRLLNCRYVPELKWYLIVEQTEDAMLAPFRKELFINLVIALLITTIVSLICITGIKRHHDHLERRNLELTETNKRVESQKVEIEKAAASLELVNEVLSERNKEKDEFIGIVAHDLRNPVSGIIGLCRVTDPCEGDLTEFVQEIQSSGERMLTLLGTLLDVSRIEGQKAELKEQQVDVNQLIGQSIDLHVKHAKRKNIEMLPKLENKEECQVATDPDWIFICINNLISNAVKYTPEYGQICVRTESVGDRVEISFEDSGPGISEEDQNKLFGKFARLSARPTGGESTTGLGLYVVKNMCDRLGIDISVSSLLGSGTTFKLSIKRSS